MVKKNDEVTFSWASTLEKQVKSEALFSGQDNIKTLEDYRTRINEAWERMEKMPNDNKAAQLDSSKGFSVQSATIGSMANLQRQFKPTTVTLNDLFTLTHQNQNAVIARFNASLIKEDELISNLPKLVGKTMKMVEEIRENNADDKKPMFTGIDLREGGGTLMYTKSLSNHSLDVQIDYDASGGVRMGVKFFGERGEVRWKFAEKLAKGFNDVLPFESIVPASSHEVQFEWALDEESLPQALAILNFLTYLIAPSQVSRFAVSANFLDSVKGTMDPDIFDSIILKIFNDKELLFTTDNNIGNQLKQINIHISPLLLSDSPAGAALRAAFDQQMESYGKSHDPAVISSEIRHIKTILDQIDAFYHNSYTGVFYIEESKKMNSHYLNLDARQKIASLVEKYRAVGPTDAAILKDIRTKLAEFPPEKIKELQAFRALEVEKMRIEKAKKVKTYNPQDFAEYTLTSLNECVTERTGVRWNISLEKLRASNVLTDAEKLDVQHICDGDEFTVQTIQDGKIVPKQVNYKDNQAAYADRLTFLYWKAQIFDGSDLSGQDKARVESALMGLLAADRNFEDEPIVYADVSFQGWNEPPATGPFPKDTAAKNAMSKATQKPMWYKQGVFSYMTLDFILNPTPRATDAQSKVVKLEKYKRYMNLSSASNAHVGCDVPEPLLWMVDPFDGQRKEFPNSEFIFQYKKRYFFYQKIQDPTIKQEFAKVTMALREKYMNQHPHPNNAEYIGNKPVTKNQILYPIP